MVQYTDVYSSADSVEELEITEATVTVRSGIEAVEEAGTDDTPGFKGWKIAKETVYEKDEYIKLISERNTSLEATVDNILTDVIPSLVSE